MMNVVNPSRRSEFLSALAGGASIRQAARIARINKNTAVTYVKMIRDCLADCDGVTTKSTARGQRTSTIPQLLGQGVQLSDCEDILHACLHWKEL